MNQRLLISEARQTRTFADVRMLRLEQMLCACTERAQEVERAPPQLWFTPLPQEQRLCSEIIMHFLALEQQRQLDAWKLELASLRTLVASLGAELEVRRAAHTMDTRWLISAHGMLSIHKNGSVHAIFGHKEELPMREICARILAYVGATGRGVAWRACQGTAVSKGCAFCCGSDGKICLQ